MMHRRRSPERFSLVVISYLVALLLPSTTLAQIESFASYTPATDVSDFAAISLDQAEIEHLVNEKDDDPDNADFAGILSDVLHVYRMGGNSAPYARLTLSHPLRASYDEGTLVSLFSGSQFTTPGAQGTLLDNAPVGATQIDVLYNTMGAENTCRISFFLDHSTDHCFPDTGRIWLGSFAENSESFYDYVYSPEQDTLSDRTIRRFSTDTHLHYVNGDEASGLHKNMEIFKEYYGFTDYADRIMWATLTLDDAGLTRGNIDFANNGDAEAAGEVALRGTVLLNIFMMILRELEHSVDLCDSHLTDVLDYSVEVEPVRAVDKAVAYYVGSLEGKLANNSTESHVQYFLSNFMCSHFNTCKDVHASLNNEDIFFDFNTLKDIYVGGEPDCREAERIIESSLTKELIVPMVQGTLFYAYLQHLGDESDVSINAEGAVIAASILPYVHACNEDDAELIYQQMKLGRGGTTKFAVVKQALERNYRCMGLSCYDIGGVFIHSRHPEGAEPCSDSEPEAQTPSSSDFDTTPTTSTDSDDSQSTTTLPEVASSSYKKLGSYTPTTYVEDHATIALDQAELEYIVTGQAESLEHSEITARMLNVYQNGGNSRPYARLYLSQDLPAAVYRGTPVAVVDGENVINGELLETANMGASEIRVLYTSDEELCRVKFFLRPSIENCFPSTGTIRIGGVIADESFHEYQYLPVEDTFGDRTLQSFSTDAALHHVMGASNGPFHPIMQLFVDYHGEVEYADKIVFAALTNDDPRLDHRRNFVFSDLSNRDNDDYTAIPAAAMTGTVVLHTFMMVLRELEHSLDLCNADQNDDLDFGNPIHALDKAVAYYKGSLDGNFANNSTDPHMMFFLAETMCELFNTCDDDGARINGDILYDFKSLQVNYLGQPDCAAAADIVYGSLIKELYVPLVQGLLLFAFKQREGTPEVWASSVPGMSLFKLLTSQADDGSVADRAHGAMFAASILPILHACSEEDATLVFNQLKPTSDDPVNFPAVKRALERNYECMGISCIDIGGVFGDGNYYHQAEPCTGNDAGVSSDDDENVIDIKISVTALHVMLYSVLAAVAFFCASGGIFFGLKVLWRYRRSISMDKDGVFVDKTLEPDDMFDEEIDFEVRDVTIPTIEIT